jgi:virginiamycin B lyase
VNLLPGSYEVSVKKAGFAEEVKKIVVKAGSNATADFSLQEAAPDPKDAPIVSYDAMYPPGKGRDLMEKTCLICHMGVGFFPLHQWSESQWNAALDKMMDPAAARIMPGTFSADDRKEVVAYLTKNFGPNSILRRLDVPELPVDEEVLSKAMYVEYYLPHYKNLQTHDPHFDQNGNVWYTDNGARRIGKIDPRTATFKDYTFPDPKVGTHGLTADAAGNMWSAGSYAMTRVDPGTGEMKVFPINPDLTKSWGAHTPVVDSRQNVWFTILGQNRLGRWNSQTQEIGLWEVPTYNSMPYGVIMDKKDSVWMAEWIRCKIANFNPATQKFTEYSPPTTPCNTKRLGLDSRGMIWFGTVVLKGGKLVKLDPNTGKMVEYAIPRPYASPYDVLQDHDGDIWIGDDSSLNVQGPVYVLNPALMRFDTALTKFDPRTEKFTFYPLPQRTATPKMELTRDGAIWYCPRDASNQGVGVLYPDMTKMTTLAAYY